MEIEYPCGARWEVDGIVILDGKELGGLKRAYRYSVETWIEEYDSGAMVYRLVGRRVCGDMGWTFKVAGMPAVREELLKRLLGR